MSCRTKAIFADDYGCARRCVRRRRARYSQKLPQDNRRALPLPSSPHCAPIPRPIHAVPSLAHMCHRTFLSGSEKEMSGGNYKNYRINIVRCCLFWVKRGSQEKDFNQRKRRGRSTFEAQGTQRSREEKPSAVNA